MAKRRCDRRPLLAVVVLGAASSMAIHSALSTTLTSSHPASSPDDVVRSWPTAANSPDNVFPSWPTASGRVRGRRSAGMHVCTCLADDDAAADDDDHDDLDPPRRLRWLHIPKTGTSFVSTLWSYAVSDEYRYIDLNVNPHMCDNLANGRVGGTSMYDFVLMRRYPWEMYGAPNMIHPSPRNSSSRTDPSGGGGRPTTTDGGAVPLGLVGGTQHLPLSRGYARDRRGSEVYDHNFTVVAFFRRPDDRIVSAYYDGRHASGFVGELWREVVAASTQRRKGEHSCTIEVNVTTGVGAETTTNTTTTTYRNPLECYARFPGIAGCASRMLTGGTCADGASRGDGLDGVEEAVEIVGRLDFVGLTEEWDESVCHFHRLFGRRRAAVVDSNVGENDDEEDGGNRRRRRQRRGRRAHPLQGEFGNVHKSAKKKVLDIEDLNGFLDVADEAVYEAARLRFEKMVGDEGGERCHRYMTWEEIDAAAEGGAGHYLPDLVRDKDDRVCEPMACSDLGKQCGEWDDGCGRTVICGMCDPGRTGLPSTWRVKCVEGECIDYCPPWDERGLWFLSDDSPLSDMKKIGEAMEIPDGRKHLSPVDAVHICQMACDIETQFLRGLESFVNTGLCRCGKPSKILSKNLTSLDFSKAHDMDAACYTNKARKDAVLTSRETQPVCCPYIDQQTKIPIGWKRLNTFGAFNVEGEYFDHVRMECGAFKECELAGRVRGAEVIVFDSFNKLCYFVRNVFDLKDMYTVKKDNYMRYTMDLRSSVRPFIARTKNDRLSKPA